MSLAVAEGEKINPFNMRQGQQQEMLEKVRASLNAYGDEGWELCLQMNQGLVFKRPR